MRGWNPEHFLTPNLLQTVNSNNQTLMKRTFVFFFLLAACVAAFAQGLQVGDVASSFSLLNVDGNMVSPDDEAYDDAEGYIVIFTCNSCPYAVAYEDRIIELHNTFASQGYPVIAINPNATRPAADSYENMIVRADEKNFEFPYLFDETQEITTAYGAKRTPHLYLLQKSDNGDKVVRYIGTLDNNAMDEDAADVNYVANAINELKAGESVSQPNTKAIGCGIKWIQ